MVDIKPYSGWDYDPDYFSRINQTAWRAGEYEIYSLTDGHRLDVINNLAKINSRAMMGEDIPQEEYEALGGKENADYYRKMVESSAFGGTPYDRAMRQVLTMYRLDEDQYDAVAKAGEQVIKELVEASTETAMEAYSGRQGGDTHGGDWMGGMKPENIVLSPADMRKILKLMQKLREIPVFKVMQEKTTDREEDPAGPHSTVVLGRSLEDLEPTMLALDEDYFDSLWMRSMLERVQYEAYKPEAKKHVVLLDDSGSMSRQSKVRWTLAVFTILIEDIRDNGSEMWLFLFEKQLHFQCKISTYEEGLHFVQHQYCAGSGGDTNVQGALLNLSYHIKNEAYGLSPDCNIFLINDGQDPVDKTFRPAVTSHGLMLMEENPDLVQVLKGSGGVALLADHRDVLTEL